MVFCTTRKLGAHFVMYSAIVTFPFTTLHLGRGLIMRFVQLARGVLYIGEGSAAIQPSILYNSRWAHTCFVMYCTNACACDLCATVPFHSPLCVWVMDSSCGLYNSPEGALYIGEGSALRRHCVLYNSHWAHACFVLHCTIVTFPLHHCEFSVHHFAFE